MGFGKEKKNRTNFFFETNGYIDEHDLIIKYLELNLELRPNRDQNRIKTLQTIGIYMISKILYPKKRYGWNKKRSEAVPIDIVYHLKMLLFTFKLENNTN